MGTRDYYRKLGYHLEGPYMVKLLNADEPEPTLDMGGSNEDDEE